MLTRIIKYTLLITIAAIVIFCIVEINSQNPIPVLKNLLKNDSLSSSSLHFKLNYLLLVPVGEAKLDNLGNEKFRNQDFIHFRAKAGSFDCFKNLFYATATLDSYIDPKELHSVYFLEHSEISNKPNEDKEISYDQIRHIMRYQGKRGIEERVIAEHSQDPLSAIFYIQNKEFNINQEFKLSMNTNQKNYILSGKVISSESIQIAEKKYKIWFVQAQVSRKDKNPRHKTSLKIWFLETEGKKMPILIKAMTNIGPIVAKLK